jgi:prepilin-type N-terminal cleavage/methylation domain-containing protein
MKKNKGQGFTLFELLVSISIIAILTVVAIVSYSNAQKKARDARRIQDVDAVGKALEQYYADNTTYPANLGLLVPSYLQASPVDPKTKAAYAYDSTTSFCLCATLEDENGGNYGGTDCSAGTGFYCRKGQQE